MNIAEFANGWNGSFPAVDCSLKAAVRTTAYRVNRSSIVCENGEFAAEKAGVCAPAITLGQLQQPVYNRASRFVAAWLRKYVYETLTRADIADLTEFLVDPKRPDGTLCFQELQGFLLAVASSPELIPPSAWWLIISNEEDIGFKDENEAQRLMGLIMSLYNEINIAVLERSGNMPLGCEFLENVEDNFNENLAISQWSRGFMMGHDWLTNVWDDYLPEEIDGEFGSTVMALSFFSSRSLAEAYHAEMTTTPRHRRPQVSFIEYAETVRRLFPDALSSYAHIGRTISEVLASSRGSDA